MSDIKTYSGLKNADAVDDGPVPAAFCAVTVQVYVFPSARPVTVACSVVEVCLAACPPSLLIQTMLYKDISP